MKKGRENKTRDLEKTRQLILDAAAGEFAVYGFSGARVDRIAREAGVNKAMIYYIYKNKDELHLAVLEHLFEAKTRQVEAHLKSGNLTLQSLYPVLQGYFKTLLEKKDYATIILYDLAAGGASLRALKKKRPDLYAEFDTVAAMLKLLQQSGAIRSIDPDKSIVLMVLIVVGLAGLLPHMDLVISKKSPAFKSLSSQDEWLAFMADVIFRVLKPE
ncbi:MAG: TetR/AcrR family transcriptional regulator [Thermodesulfobacteriota bacterium]